MATVNTGGVKGPGGPRRLHYFSIILNKYVIVNAVFFEVVYSVLLDIGVDVGVFHNFNNLEQSPGVGCQA